jgi:glycosyltransferase involved in cell wall biosynthesis
LIAKLARNREERSILFIESYTLLDLFALAIGITLFSKRRVELWHVIRDGLEWHPFKRRVHQMFSSLFGRYPYRLFTDSEKIVTSVGKTISLLPIPHICSFRSDQIGIRKERTRLWLPGKCRSDKGAKHVIQLAMSQELCLKRVDLLIEPSEALKGAVIRVIPTPSDLSRSEYEQTLASVDALLLPYDPVIYISRTSGPFVEAICAGKMVFTKAGNWLAYELEKHDLGECILNWEESDLGMQITSILNRQQTRQKFSSMRSTYLSFHNQENFKKILTSFI